jgi:glycosyltransferase involved in cell wall biosynthesis
MKIVYCLPDTYKPGGLERVVSLKANYLADVFGYDVTIVTSGQNKRKPYYEFSKKINFIDLDINHDNILNLSIIKRILYRRKLRIKHKMRLQDVLLNLKADIVISTFTHEASFLPNIKDGSKKILEFHFFRGHKRTYANSFNFPIITKLAYYFKAFKEEYFLVKKYDQFVVLTEEDKELWKPVCKNVISIPNILPFNQIKNSRLENKKVIAVGRLDAQKGFDKLINIWKEIYNVAPDWRLDIYGAGEDEQALKELVLKNKLQNVVNINKPVKNIQDKYLESSIYAMTSRYEGMPMTLLEAMNLGLPCVSYSFKCGPRDIIKNDIDGFCIKEDDSKLFIERLNLLMKDTEKRIKMGKLAKTNISRYKIDNVMLLWNKLFKELNN